MSGRRWGLLMANWPRCAHLRFGSRHQDASGEGEAYYASTGEGIVAERKGGRGLRGKPGAGGDEGSRHGMCGRSFGRSDHVRIWNPRAIHMYVSEILIWYGLDTGWAAYGVDAVSRFRTCGVERADFGLSVRRKADRIVYWIWYNQVDDYFRVFFRCV